MPGDVLLDGPRSNPWLRRRPGEDKFRIAPFRIGNESAFSMQEKPFQSILTERDTLVGVLYSSLAICREAESGVGYPFHQMSSTRENASNGIGFGLICVALMLVPVVPTRSNY